MINLETLTESGTKIRGAYIHPFLKDSLSFRCKLLKAIREKHQTGGYHIHFWKTNGGNPDNYSAGFL